MKKIRVYFTGSVDIEITPEIQKVVNDFDNLVDTNHDDDEYDELNTKVVCAILDECKRQFPTINDMDNGIEDWEEINA